MILSKVKLRGFRNFKKSTINLNNKTLIIGANDVGKTNLIWAIRLLLDRSLSDYDIEPRDSDFYAYNETNTFSILLCFTEVDDDCVVSKMKGKISDDSKLYIKYEACRNSETNAKIYKLYAGPCVNMLEEIDSRYYLKVLNLKYIGSRRDLHNYVNREKNYLFQIAKDNRNEAQTDADNTLYSEIQDDLKNIDSKIPKLNFVSNATSKINEELSKLSLHHNRQEVVFDSATSNVDSFIKSVGISSKCNGKNILIGGDGRLNQIYLALWASRNELTEESLSEVSIFCIEEPEAHLHPHQQRKLAEYLNSSLKGQVLITSHSPQITSEFTPNSIVRLFCDNGSTQAASNGCSQIIDDAFTDFGYRMSIIPAEAFFASVVFLVEGPSEEIFYKTLAKNLAIDLDQLNISILMVDGIGFGTFIKILNSLKIEWVLRTDNDIFKVPQKDEYRFAGIQRCIKYYRDYFNPDTNTDKILAANESHLRWPNSRTPTQQSVSSAKLISDDFSNYYMFLSEIDLENDLFNSPMKKEIKDFFSDCDEDDIVNKMQSYKAINMYEFLKKKKDKLSCLENDNIAKPLYACVKIVNELNEAD